MDAITYNLGACGQRVAVAMSGGLDSSAAALLLHQSGADVFGLTAKTWPHGSRCCADEDIHHARRVCDRLGIPHYVVDVEAAFDRFVVSYFVEEYAAGRTPSPCGPCNRRIKFGILLDKALGLGASRLATGHYVRCVGESDGPYRLLVARDGSKDQSYFLFGLSQYQLAHSYFPLGELHKSAVRERVKSAGLPTVDRGESQDLCFVQPGRHHCLVEERRSEVRRTGRIMGPDGQQVGEHQGIHRYTIGQRRGLGVAADQPLYVARLDADTNTVYLAPRDGVLTSEIRVDRVNWLAGKSPVGPIRVQVKIRYAGPSAAALVSPDGGSVRVLFEAPQFAVTPGQIAAFYQGEELLGGGWMSPLS